LFVTAIESFICFYCSALRRLRGFSPRFLECAALIAGGEREPLIGLLEDCHRYYDGIEPAPFWPETNVVSACAVEYVQGDGFTAGCLSFGPMAQCVVHALWSQKTQTFSDGFKT
jgi:hypothetical protein